MYYFNSSKTKDLYKDMSPFNKDMSSNKNKKIKPSGQCIHLGEYIGKTACTSCCGGIELKIFNCNLLKCGTVIGNKKASDESVMFCKDCPNYEA